MEAWRNILNHVTRLAAFAKSPVYSYIVLQICLWFMLHICLSFYLYLGFRFMVTALKSNVSVHLSHILSYALFFALFHGVVLGIVSYFIDKLLFIAKSAGRIIVLQVAVSIIVFLITVNVAQHYTSNRFLMEKGFSEETWNGLFHVLLCQYVFASFIVALANQTFRKYGRDVFVPLMLGAYRKPHEQQKIFLFIDLKSSTTLAEQLGHVRYSSLVQEFMFDINRSLHQYHANIYQYAGDEVVITWSISKRNVLRCLRFYFACQDILTRRKGHYLQKHGVVPMFKAGAHCGMVTAVEIGDMKRDIAYHGDTVNTASRIQALCNSTMSAFLVSNSFCDIIPDQSEFVARTVGLFVLKGKENSVEIFSIERAGKLVP